MFDRGPVVAGVIIAASAFLVGCSSPISVATDTYSGPPPDSDLTIDDALDGGPVVTWESGTRNFTLTTFGSSTCAPVPTGVTLEDQTRVTVELASSGNSQCTADSAMTSHELTLPPDTDVDRALKFAVAGDDYTAPAQLLER